MSIVVSIALGLGLASAAGLRVFVPLLAAGIAANRELVHLVPAFEWLSSPVALVALGVATLLEVGAYYVPWLDHALDVIATPSAVAAGIVSSAAVMTDLTPAVRWLVAIIGGGGVAGLVQGATVLARLKSTALTGGAANPLVSTAELIGAVVVVCLAVLVPVVCLLLLAAGVALIFRASGRVLFGRRRTA